MKIIIRLPRIRKNAWIHNFSLTITFQFLFHFRDRSRLLLFNDVLFAQEIPKKLIPVCMDYDVTFRDCWKSKVISVKLVWNHCETSRRYIKIHGPQPLDPAPNIFLLWIKTFGVKIRPAVKTSYLFHELEEMKSWYCEIIVTCENTCSR